MMSKFYCKISGNHTTYVRAGGVVKKVVFDNSAGNAAGFGELVTDDRELVAALMADSRYGAHWFADAGTVQAVEVQAVPEAELAEFACHTVNEAAEWLMGLGCQKNKVNTSEKAVATARELGYALRFEKR